MDNKTEHDLKMKDLRAAMRAASEEKDRAFAAYKAAREEWDRLWAELQIEERKVWKKETK